MDEDWELLERWARRREEGAFGELVRRHAGLVYGAARRRLGGPGREAEDVTQAVFLLLTQMAGRISRRGTLAGWLYRVTGYCCRNVRKEEGRRKKREREAAMERVIVGESVGPIAMLLDELDEALEGLGEKERAAILVRYLEGKTAAETGAVLGISAEAVEKRLERGIAKLRGVFARKGFAVPAAGVVGVMVAEGAKGVSAGVAASAMGVTGGASGVAAGIAKGAAVMMKMAMVKVAALGIIVLVMMWAGIMVGMRVVGHGAGELRGAVAATSSKVVSTEPAATVAATTQAGVAAEKLLEAALRAIKDQQESVKNLTASGLSKHEELEKTGKWNNWEQDVTATYEGVGVKRWRLDCRHEITPWINGAAPFSIESYYQVYDGRVAMKLDAPDGTVDFVAHCMVTAGRPYQIDVTCGATCWLWSVLGWASGPQIEGDPAPVRLLEFIENARKLAGFRVEAVTEGERRYLKVVVPEKGDPGKHEWRFWMDMKRDYALARVEVLAGYVAPGVKQQYKFMETVITDFTEPRAGLFYPKHVEMRLFRPNYPKPGATVIARTNVDVSSVTVNDDDVGDKTFKLDLPEGTNVFDDFGGDPVVISGTAEEKEKEIAGVVERVVKHAKEGKGAATRPGEGGH